VERHEDDDSKPGLSKEDWAERLREDWERRSRSAGRDFYVASHQGWDDDARWAEHARGDVDLILHGLEPERIAAWQVLEIGCGVGRLGGVLAQRFAGYSGFDIAPGMVEEARLRLAGAGNARVSVGDGMGPPAELCDRTYELIIALAVFIHCPRELIAANVQAAFPLLAPGGQLRFQLMADPEDPTGVVSLEAAAELHEQMLEVEAEVVTPEQLELIKDTPYIGARFRYDEVAPFLEAASGGKVTTVRVDLAHIYGWIEPVTG